MADVVLRSYQQILGQSISRLLADTDLNDLSPGSVFLTILEAAASSDFSQEGKLLQLINLRNPDKTTGTDLVNLAAEMGLTPPQIGAAPSSVKISISDSAFLKISTNVFSGAVSPAAGDTTLKVVDATTFPASGTVYVGRGTSTSEATSYVSKTSSGSFWTLFLSGPLTKDHLVNEEVVFGQGGDRLVSAGSIARVPASSGTPAIEFSTVTDATLLDGEDEFDGIGAQASDPGAKGNVGIGKITEFSSPPFATALVTNPEPATGGVDVETDPELRQRVKDHVHNLGRGTQRAVISAVVGTTDPDEGKRVVSAFLREPTGAGALGVLFIDDGTGFAPSFAGVGEETIVTSATGTEQFFQLQQFPLVKAQIVSVGTEPFALEGGERLFVEIDGVAEERSIPGTSYRIPGVVMAQEIAESINKTFTSIEARAKDGRLFITPAADDPDYVRIGSATSGTDANSVVRFPTRKAFTLLLYKDDVLLEKNGSEAKIQSFPNTAWPPFSSSETLQLSVDGISTSLITIMDADFSALTSSSTISGAGPADWAIVLNAKFIGVTSSALDDGTVLISSNRGRSSSAKISVVSGTLAGTFISATAASTGKSSEYKLNRLLGQIETSSRLASKDGLKAGTTDTEGFVDTPAQSAFDLSTTLGSAAEMVIVADAPISILVASQTASLLTFSSPSSGIQRIAGAVGQFSNVQADDFCHTYNLSRSALLKVKAVATNGSSVDLFDPAPISGSDTPNGTTKTIRFFRTIGLPQLVVLPVGAAVSSSAIVTSFDSQVSGSLSEILDSSAIRFKTLRLDASGALGIPVLAGTSTNLGITAASYDSHESHIATIESAELTGLPSGRYTISVNDLTPPFDDLQVSGSPFGVEHSNRPIIHYVGASEALEREPLERLTASRLTLRDEPPNPAVGLGPDAKLTSGAGCEFGQTDNMVFIVDDDAAKKTFDIPMYVDATIAAPSVPTTTQFDAADAAGDLLGSSTRWLGHRFEDYRVWLQSHADLPFSTANTQIRTRAVQFGPNGKKILAGVFYPSSPGASESSAFQLDQPNADVLVSLFLGSGAERAIGLAPNRSISVSSTGPVSGLYTHRIQFIPPVDLTPVLVGDVMSVLDSAFSAANQGQSKVSAVSNLSDTSRSYQHLKEDSFGATITGTTSYSLSGPPTQAIEVGDKFVAVDIRKTVTLLTSSTVTVATGGAFSAGGGNFTINATSFTYTSYTSGTGVFAGVTPDPTTFSSPGDTLIYALTPVTRLVATTITTTTGTIAAPGFPSGDGYHLTIEHKALTSDFAPSFSAQAGDKIQVASQLLTITSVVSPTIFEVDTPFTFTGLQSGTISRIFLEGKRSTAAVTETISSTSAQAVRVFPLSGTTATALIATVASTAGVKDLITAANAPGSNGSGMITTSTEDELANGSTRSRLLNGESFVKTTASSSPAITLKAAFDLAPEIGEKVRLVPAVPKNIADHFNRKQISGLSIAADVNVVNEARRVQISTKTPGGIGQVFAVGGKASGATAIAVRGSSLSISSSVGQIELDRAAGDLVVPGHTILVKQTGRVKKSFIGSSPIAGTTATVSIVSPGVGRLTFGVALAAEETYTHTGTVKWIVRNLSRGRLRFEVLEGTASVPATLAVDDFVFVGDGTSYAGTTPSVFFAAANRGTFQVRETDQSTYFDVDAVGTEQIVSVTSAPFVFFPYHSARIGDQITIGAASPLSTANQGTFVITNIFSNSAVDYANANVVSEGPFALGSGGTDSIRILDQGFSTYRKVLAVSPSLSDPSSRAILMVSPGTNTNLINEAQGAKVTFPNRLGFTADPVPGMSGYQYWTGLKRRAQRVIDGFEPDSSSFPGVRAAGVGIEAREPQIQRVTLNLKIKTKEGVALASISDLIKSSVIGFINSLGLSQDVVLSEIVSLVQGVSGVDAVVLVSPTLDTERITIADKAIARSSPNEIFLS